MLIWFTCILAVLLAYIGLSLALMRLPVEPEQEDLKRS